MEFSSIDSETRPPDLEEPPSPDEGRVAAVHLKQRNLLARADHTSPCAICGADVRWDSEHVLAMVQLENVPTGTRYLRPRFCDRECWADCASR